MTTTHAPTYELRDVPARDDGRSRFSLPATSKGWSLPGPGSVLAHNLGVLASEAETEARAKPSETAIVRLYAVCRDAEGSYKLRGRGTVEGRVESEPVRPGRFARTGKTPGETLDSFFLREPGSAYEKAPDAAVWQAALKVAAAEGVAGAALRTFNEAIARALLVRAGLAPVHPSELPQEHLRAEPKPAEAAV